MAQTYFTLVGNRTRDTEGLKALSDGCCSVCGSSAAFLDGDGCACNISPACVLKTDGLDAFDHVVNFQACIFGDLLCFFQRRDSVAVQNLVDLINSSLI